MKARVLEYVALKDAWSAVERAEAKGYNEAIDNVRSGVSLWMDERGVSVMAYDERGTPLWKENALKVSWKEAAGLNLDANRTVQEGRALANRLRALADEIERKASGG